MSVLHEGNEQIESFDNNDTNDGNCNDDAHIIRIRGLPWNTTKKEICDFFDGVNIVNGENGIHLVTLATNNTKPLGEAYIELASFDDFERAQTFHKKNLGSRYIEVFESTFDEFQCIMNKQRGAEDESVVRLRGLPWNATEADIADFFQGLQIKRNNGIYIPHNRNGKASGEAFVHFETIEDCEQALQRNMNELGHRYIEIFRSTEQQLMRSMMQTNPNRGNFGGRNNVQSNQSNGNNRMHPYERNGNKNNFGRGNQNARGRNQNNRNDFRRDRSNNGDMFMQNSNQPNNRNFGNNRMFNNSRNGNGGGGIGNSFGNAFNQNNQNSNDNFFEDFDLNEFSKNLNSFERSGNNRQDFGGNRNQRLLDLSSLSNDFFANSNWNSSNNQFNSRGNGGNGNGGGSGNSSFGGNNDSFGGSNNRFNNNKNSRNNDSRSGQHCIHMRGLPYYTDEMDVFNFFAPLKPSFCKIIINNKGLHSGEAKAYFDYYEQVRTALSKDRMKIGSRYIELFYAGSN